MNSKTQSGEKQIRQHRRTRVLVIITKADVGGAQVHVLQILRELGGHFEFILVTGEEGFLTRKARASGAEVLICHQLTRPIRPLKDLAAIVTLVKLIQSYRPSFVHAHSFKAGVVARCASTWSRVPAIFTAHGWVFTPGVPRGQFLLGLIAESVLCRLSSAVVTISRHDFELAKKYRIGCSRAHHLIPNAAESKDNGANPKISPVSLLSVGRLTPVKNQQLLIKAMLQLPEEVTLTIVGEGVERAGLERIRSDLGLMHRVDLPGEVEDVEPYLSSSQIFVLCSNYEGLPISILEAMHAGLPVISTDVGGVSEAVVHDRTGFLVPRGNLKKLIAGLRTLVAEPELRSRFGREGRFHSQKHYTVARFSKQMMQVYAAMPHKAW